MKDLIIINDEQFGYHTDTLKYVQYLKKKYQIIFICLDHGKNKIIEEETTVIYITGSTKSFSVKALIKIYSLGLINPLIFVKWHPLSFAYRLYLKRATFFLDIRTFAVLNNKFKRFYWDFFLLFDSLFYKNITIINKNLIDRIKLLKKWKNIFILPLGADINKESSILFNNNINLIYIGTFNNRQLVDTVEGVSNFYLKYCHEYNITYTIYGDGKESEKNLIKLAIRNCNATSYIHLKGYINQSKINDVLIKNNVGVSYIPITHYYNHQPPTKTFEYLASGLVVLATNTAANNDIIDLKNGVLIEDTAKSFFKGLELIVRRRKSYKSEEIKNSISMFTWDKITNKLHDVLKEV